MTNTPETDREMRDVWLKADDLCVETWAEKNGDTIDVVDADFARRLERQRDALQKKLDEKEKAHQVTRDTARRLSAEKHQAASQRDAYAETLRQIATSAVCGNIVRERHPELENAKEHPTT